MNSLCYASQPWSSCLVRLNFISQFCKLRWWFWICGCDFFYLRLCYALGGRPKVLPDSGERLLYQATKQNFFVFFSHQLHSSVKPANLYAAGFRMDLTLSQWQRSASLNGQDMCAQTAGVWWLSHSEFPPVSPLSLSHLSPHWQSCHIGNNPQEIIATNKNSCLSGGYSSPTE